MMKNLIQAMDLNDYNSQLCRSGCSLQHLETMENISGLAVQDLYSGSILKPTVMDDTTYELQHALLDMYTEQYNKNTVS